VVQGAVRHVEITASPVRDAGGRIIAGIEVVRDVTERKRLSEEMAKTEKLESVGLLAGGIAHDFNNLLTGIFGNISLAKMHASGNELVGERLAEAEKASLRASELTRQLLTFAKGGIPIKKTQSIAGIITEAVGFTLSGSRVKAAFALPDDLPPLDVDAGQLHQVFNNLALNAIQAMPQGGVLTVTAARDRPAAGAVPRLPAGDYVRISIADTGDGISPDILPRIFDPYFTTKKTGTGLGLATVYSIVKKHGGGIAAGSRPGSGAVFDIYLPLSTGKAAIVPQKPPVMRGAGTILIMDDEQLILNTADQMLRTLGYRCTCSRDGVDAVSRYKAAFRSKAAYDAVILDLTVPGGLGGREAMQQLLAFDPRAVGIVSSGYSDDPVMADHRLHGFKGMLAKPYDAEALGRAIHSALQG
jgi:signal transduction histidine kinase/CheY-like chemotaxis protein